MSNTHFVQSLDGSDRVLNDFTYLDSIVPGYWTGMTKQSEYNDALGYGFALLSAAVQAAAAPSKFSRTVTKTSHGFTSGDLMKGLYETGGSDSGSGAYYLSQGDSATHGRMLGILTSITDANHFVLSWGYMDGFSGLTASSPYYQDPSTAGAFTTTKPTTSGQVDSVALFPVGSTRAYVNLLLDPHVVP